MLIHSEGTLELTSSVFRFNEADSTAGVVNLGGQIDCYSMECLSACTACVLVPSRMPSPPPSTPRPTVEPTAARGSKTDVNNRTWLVFGLVFGWCLLFVWWCRIVRHRAGRACGFGLDPDGGAAELPSNQQSLLQLDNATTESGSIELDASDLPSNQHLDNATTESGSIELIERSVMIKSYETSPAPVFVVGRESMQVSIWSPGMAIVVPTLMDPVGSLLSHLPFVSTRDGDRLNQFLRSIFEAPAEHDHARTCMVHLRANNNRPVLLEMVATHFHVRESEPIIVMVGRQIDSDLAVLLASETVPATSEANHDVNRDDVCWDGSVSHLLSASQAGSMKGDDDDLHSKAIIHVPNGNPLVMPTVEPSLISNGSVVSSITAPTMDPGNAMGSYVAASSRDVRDCARAIAFKMLCSELALRSSSVSESSTSSARACEVLVNRSELSDP